MRTIGLVLLLTASTATLAQTARSTATTASDGQIEAPVLVASRTTDMLPEFSTSVRPMLNVARPVDQRVIAEQKAAKLRKEVWYALAVTSHGSAFLDAWSTRDVLSHGGREMNPLVQPFANSGAIYPMLQVGPTAMDYLGRRMMRSNSRLLRDTFWVPQFASTAISVSCGVHNMGVR